MKYQPHTYCSMGCCAEMENSIVSAFGINYAAFLCVFHNHNHNSYRLFVYVFSWKLCGALNVINVRSSCETQTQSEDRSIFQRYLWLESHNSTAQLLFEPFENRKRKIVGGNNSRFVCFSLLACITFYGSFRFHKRIKPQTLVKLKCMMLGKVFTWAIEA